MGLTAALSLFGSALPLSIAGANMGWALVLAALLYRRRLGDRPAWSAARGALELPLWAYLAAAVLTALLGLDPARSMRSMNQEAHKVWLYYLLSIALAAGSSRLPLAALAGGFAFASLTGIAQVFTGALSGAPVRAHAFVHPVTYGEQTAVGLLGAFCFLLSPPKETASGRPRRLLWLLAALLAAGLLLSNTRGAALGAAAGALAVLWLAPHRRRWSAAALLVCSLSFIAMDLSHADRSFLNDVLGRGAAERPQLMRLTFWNVALRMGAEHPLTGVGLNNYRTAFNRYYSGPLEGGAKDWGDAHNLYLHQFAERGLLGAAALFWLLGAFWWRALSRAKAAPSAGNLWAYGTATAFLVMNLTETAFQIEAAWMLVFFVWLWAEAEHRRTSHAY